MARVHKFAVGERKFTLRGTPGEVARAQELISGLTFVGRPEDRLLLQDLIDWHKLKADITPEDGYGWSVRSFTRIITEYERLVRSGSLSGMTEYFYDFLNQECGSIAHFNRHGWIAHYGNSVAQLQAFFLENEFGTSILHHIPAWRPEGRRVAAALVNRAADALSRREAEFEWVFSQLRGLGWVSDSRRSRWPREWVDSKGGGRIAVHDVKKVQILIQGDLRRMAEICLLFADDHPKQEVS